MWQDKAFFIVGALFAYSLIPTIIEQHKLKLVSMSWQQLFITIICMAIACACYITMAMWWAVTTNLLCFIGWNVIAYQKRNYERQS